VTRREAAARDAELCAAVPLWLSSSWIVGIVRDFVVSAAWR